MLVFILLAEKFRFYTQVLTYSITRPIIMQIKDIELSQSSTKVIYRLSKFKIALAEINFILIS